MDWQTIWLLVAFIGGVLVGESSSRTKNDKPTWTCPEPGCTVKMACDDVGFLRAASDAHARGHRT